MNRSAPLPLLARVRDTLVAPRRLFAGFGADAPWFAVLLLSTVVAGLAAATQPAEVYLEEMVDPVNRRGKPVTITSGPEEIVRYGRLLAFLSALVGHPIVAFALAGLLTLVFSVLGGGRSTFRQYLAVVAHALLIPALGTLLLLALGLALGHPLAAGLGFVAPGPADGFAHALLARIDAFHLWMLVVLALGVEAVDGRRRWSAAAVILLALYLLANALVAAIR